MFAETKLVNAKKRKIMELVGKGLTAEVFKLDEDKVLKLFFKDYSLDAIRREYENARLVNSFGINAPVAFGLEKIEDRTGIVYSYVKGKSIEKVFDSQSDLHFFLSEFWPYLKRIKMQKLIYCLFFQWVRRIRINTFHFQNIGWFRNSFR